MVHTLWAYRGLLWQFTVRNIEMRHKGSMLGIAWAVLNPLLMLSLYVFVFGFVFGGTFGVEADESKWDYGLGVFLGLAIFHLIAEAVTIAPTLIVGNPNFVKKVVFPLEILPAAAVGAAVIHMLITLTMVLIGLVVGGRPLTLPALGLPIVVLPIIFFSLGLSWIFAALGVFFRDIGQIVGVLVTGLMFASAIFYPASSIHSEAPFAWTFLKFNPLLHTVELSRDVLLWNLPVSGHLLLWLYISGCAVACIGFACFSRLTRTFADVV